jgi:hypothetical protein
VKLVDEIERNRIGEVGNARNKMDGWMVKWARKQFSVGLQLSGKEMEIMKKKKKKSSSSSTPKGDEKSVGDWLLCPCTKN